MDYKQTRPYQKKYQKIPKQTQGLVYNLHVCGMHSSAAAAPVKHSCAETAAQSMSIKLCLSGEQTISRGVTFPRWPGWLRLYQQRQQLSVRNPCLRFFLLLGDYTKRVFLFGFIATHELKICGLHRGFEAVAIDLPVDSFAMPFSITNCWWKLPDGSLLLCVIDAPAPAP